MRNSPAILDGGTHERVIIESNTVLLTLHRSGKITCLYIRGRIFQLLPGQSLPTCTQHICAHAICRALDIFSWIKGVKGITGSDTVFYILWRFKMVGIGTKAGAPAFGEDAPHGIIHYLLWCTTGACHLTNRLLRWQRDDMPARRTHSPQVTGRCQSQSITKSRARL